MPTLLAVRFYTESTPVLATRDNEPLHDLDDNINTVNTALGGLTTSFNTLNTDYTTHHKGLGSDPNGTPQVGVTHQNASATTGGFMSAAQYTKLSLIQDNAQVNALALVEALELVSRGSTTLHRHRNSDSNAPDLTPAGVYHDGFISAAQAAHLATVALNAQPLDPAYTAAKPALLSGTVGPPYPADALHKHASNLSVGTPTPSPPPSVSNVTNLNIIGAGGLTVGVASPSPGQANVTLTQAAAPTPAPTPGPTPLPGNDHSYQPAVKAFGVTVPASGGNIHITCGFTIIGAVVSTQSVSGGPIFYWTSGTFEAPNTQFSQDLNNTQNSGEIGFGGAAGISVVATVSGTDLVLTSGAASGITYKVVGLVYGYITATIPFP